jgi:hypothetical protein
MAHIVLVLIGLWLVWRFYRWRMNAAKALLAAVINENARLRGEMEPFELPPPKKKSEWTLGAKLAFGFFFVVVPFLGFLAYEGWTAYWDGQAIIYSAQVGVLAPEQPLIPATSPAGQQILNANPGKSCLALGLDCSMLPPEAQVVQALAPVPADPLKP